MLTLIPFTETVDGRYHLDSTNDLKLLDASTI